MSSFLLPTFLCAGARPAGHLPPANESKSVSDKANQEGRLMQDQADSQPIRLVLLDDHVLLRASLARLLAEEHGFEVVAECAAAAEALQVLKSTMVHVVLLRLGVGGDFVAATRLAGYKGKFLIVAAETDAAASITAVRRGAAGIFLESDSLSRLTQAIRLVAGGETWVSQKVIQILAARRSQPEDQSLDVLTEREERVLQGVVEGLTNRKIGSYIGASESTIKATLQHLFRKAGVRKRSQLVRATLEGSRGTELMQKVRKSGAAPMQS